MSTPTAAPLSHDPLAPGPFGESAISYEPGMHEKEMIINFGPQHPATHGTLRIVTRLDGEQVVWAEPVAGYMHRGYEKLTEVRSFPQVTTLINRIEW